MDYQVYIQNLPYEVEEREIAKWCSTFGPVESCRLKRDSTGQSRGFAFVTFTDGSGFEEMLKSGPHQCRNRLLNVRPANGHFKPKDEPSEPSSHYSPAVGSDDSSNLTSNEYSTVFNDGHDDVLLNLRDDLEANLECLRIDQLQEIQTLEEKVKREKKLLVTAEEDYETAKKECETLREQNLQLRQNLIRNTVQTFNIRRQLARDLKEQNENFVKLSASNSSMK